MSNWQFFSKHGATWPPSPLSRDLQSTQLSATGGAFGPLAWPFTHLAIRSANIARWFGQPSTLKLRLPSFHAGGVLRARLPCRRVFRAVAPPPESTLRRFRHNLRSVDTSHSQNRAGPSLMGYR